MFPFREALAAEIPAGVSGFASDVKPFFEAYCVDCHDQQTSKGEMTLDSLDGDLVAGRNLERWDCVLEKLRGREMPPAGEAQPTDAQRTAVADWIQRGLREYISKNQPAPAVPTTRRLTNFEYQNTLRDLLGFELEVIDDLPEDPEKFYDFNNTAELMRMGPEQLDRYLEIARWAMKSAIVDAEPPDVFQVRREWRPDGIDRGLGADEVGVWGNRRNTAAGGLSFTGFPKHGQFRLRMQASAILPSGCTEAPLNLDMGANPGATETPFKTIATVYLTNSPDEPTIFEFTGRIENHPYAPTKVGKNGTFVDQMAIQPRVIFDDGTLNDGYGNSRQLEMPRAVIHWIELEVPVTDIWPPPHHRAILFESPLRASDPEAYVEEVLKRFLARAFRRPASEAEIDRFMKIHGLIRPSVEAFEEAIRETLAMVLISPQFLFHTESDPATNAHFALASRLSYFLWGSMPDQELLDLAASKQLNDSAVVERQALRMLADKKSNAFVENFTLQWLSIKKSLTVPINQDLYPRFLYRVSVGETAGTEVPYRPTVRDYMMQETFGFVGEMIRRNASVLNIVDSDFAYLNQRLAAHYGVEGVAGMKLRAVPIRPEHNLGGLLTHGSVLIGNGTGTAPHPIYRAVWLREAILGDPVPLPPSDVPALTDTAGESLEKALSIADLLAKHRTNERCSDCHSRLDPWGIPFEEYNAVGRFQRKVPQDGARVGRFDAKSHGNLEGYQKYLDSINTVDVQAVARVPRGPEIDGMRELKDYLLNDRRHDIAENVLRRLMSYGIGRELNYRDRFAVDELVEISQANGFKMRDMIVAICQSPVFRDAIPSKRAE
ncbi:MAG: DUF1592 domain-containing protein [Planctomycetales bacterium]|nr:DUF1592 domain-containing protein [Planctomycetales bacterium]